MKKLFCMARTSGSSLYNLDSVSANANLFDSSFGPRYAEPRTFGVTFSYELM